MENAKKGSIVSVSPFRCRVWHLHDRLESELTEETCRAEIESFERHGQLVPALGRYVRSDPDYDVELIYGARRLFVARHINKPLLVDIRELNDYDSAIAMDIENRQRKDVCPYERGMSYARWLRAGLFRSQDEIARALEVSASQVSRLLRIAKLPSVVVDAFDSAVDICESWGLDLAEALDDPQRRSSVIQRARVIAANPRRPPAREVFRQLLVSGTAGRKPRPTSHDRVVRGRDGVPLFRVRQQRSTIALIVPMERVSAACLEKIQSAVVDVLQPVSTREIPKIVTESSISMP